jgi:hypothetical protein
LLPVVLHDAIVLPGAVLLHGADALALPGAAELVLPVAFIPLGDFLLPDAV